MEAPEKIYILNHTDYTGRRRLNAFTEKEDNNDIEYIRTDAFIEKACEWFEKNLHIYNTAECMGDRKAFIEDFKNALKGE